MISRPRPARAAGRDTGEETNVKESTFGTAGRALVIAGIATVGAVTAALAQTEAASPAGETAQRLERVEARLAEIEEFLATLGFGAAELTFRGKTVADGGFVLPATMTYKKFQRKDPASGRYQDYVWFDVLCDTALLEKPTRAVRGKFEFADLFGEVKFELDSTVKDRMEPGQPLKLSRIGFEYNQYLDAHQWLVAADPKELTIRYRVSTIVWEDGATESFE